MTSPTISVAATTPDDFPALAPIIRETGLFPETPLPDLFAEPPLYGAPDAIWLTVRDASGAAGFCFARPETFTEGTWNLLAIAVDPARQSDGLGAALVAELEHRIAALEGRLLIVDTASLADFDGARAFYLRRGFEKEAVIREFWAPGIDKVTYRKALPA